MAMLSPAPLAEAVPCEAGLEILQSYTLKIDIRGTECESKRSR